MQELNKICVFCGSSEGNDSEIYQAALSLGKAFVENNITLVYGAAKIGIMGAVAKSVLEGNGTVVGIIPGFLKKKEVVHLGLTELITTKNMHERKMKMQELSDGFIALPGGFGTLEELFEIITWLQLGLHSKPIGLLNTNGFYDDLIKLIENMVKKKFVSSENYQLLLVDTQIDSLLEKMRRFKLPDLPNYVTSKDV
ncbi:TIGR00730 family Rossman fold protein [Ulvibacter sp.]|nr:TIGR00730 family Rossman fold protein [Ulvibacter sp.]